jgi:hypothetical protein
MQQFRFNLPADGGARGGSVKHPYTLINVGTTASGGSGATSGGTQVAANPDNTVTFLPSTGAGGQTIGASQQIVLAVALPMPNDVTFAYGADWSVDETSNIERIIGGGANLALGNTSSKDYSLGGIYADLKGMIGNKLTEIGNSTALRRSLRDIGAAYNPHKELFYQGPKWRSFTLDWNLAFRNQREADDFDGFVAAIAVHMSPDFIANASSGVWQIPDTFFVEHVNAKTRKIGACVCTGFTVRYTDSGAGWKGFSADGNPAFVAISMNLLELTAIVKSDVRDGK